MDLARHGLVVLTWGNVSGIDRGRGIVVIKPSGVPYENLKADDMVAVNLDGKAVDSRLKPSSDTPTHLALYRAFAGVGGIAHTHSIHATAFAQAGVPIPCLGTTHADQFHGAVPVARMPTRKEVESGYEENVGKVIVERFASLDPLAVPAVLAAGHGPFTWGLTPAAAVACSVTLEAVAHMAIATLRIRPEVSALPKHILAKHYSRKHGPAATYGQ